MEHKKRTLLLTLPMIGVLIACELGPRKNFQAGSNTQNISERELQVMINELLTEKEGEGDDNLKGFEESSTTKALENHEVIQSVLVRTEDERDSALNSEEEQKLKEYQELLKREEKAFDFEAPEGFVASFSQPVLFPADPEPEPIRCDGLVYQTDEPTMNEIFKSAKSQGICGPV